MKNKIKFSCFKGLTLAMLLIAHLFFSCESFTEVDMPESQLTGVSVFNNLTTANAALSDIYARMREDGVASGMLLTTTSLLANYSDDLDYYGSNIEQEQFNRHTLLASNTLLSGIWNSSYSQIYAINSLIKGTQASSSLPVEGRNRIVGEALFLRAFIYTYLTSMFGDIPYVITTDHLINSKLPRMSQNQVWQNIISDLSFAESLVPEDYPSSGRVRANKGAVQALMSRVYLYTKDYVQAENYATTVIGNNGYSIPSDLNTTFLKDSPSIIWAFHPGLSGLNTFDARSFIFSEGPPIRPALSVNLYNAFESGDLRKQYWTRTVSNGTANWYYAYKYKQESTTESSQEYTIILRIEEQYLIRTEARAMMGNIIGAQEDLNLIRNRAGLPDTSADTQLLLMQAILRERRFEFFTEQSHRWFDIKRTGNASSVLSSLKPGWRERDVLLPIPENELLLNSNLQPQNPGY